MNFINCGGNSSPELLRKTVIFWSENSYQHISSLLKSTNVTTAVLQPFFREQLKGFYESFVAINQAFKEKNMPNSSYVGFLRLNQGFINLLERIKFEGFSGYPVLQQSVFHYIYEQRYINAVFGNKNMAGNVLITAYFLPFLNQSINCFYNQMYFWSIIGAMHPSLIMGNNAFYNAINGYAKELLTEICNSFNRINFELSSLKKPIKKSALAQIFEEFKYLNITFLEFLKQIKQNSIKIFSSPSITRLPSDFYKGVDHMIGEHTLVAEINENIEKMLK